MTGIDGFPTFDDAAHAASDYPPRRARGNLGRAALLFGAVGFLAVPAAFAASISSTLWVDANGNGRPDAGEPTIAGAECQLTGGGMLNPLIGTTNGQGLCQFASLPTGNYQLHVSVTQLTGSGPVAQAVASFWGTHGISSTIPIKALATQAAFQPGGFGTEVISSTIDLTGGGDSTLDLGFTHQCASICDTSGDGRVTQVDINTITTRLNRPVNPPGVAGSGNCSGSGHVSGNDRLWCQAFLQFEVGIGNRVWKEVNNQAGYQPAQGDQPFAGVQVEVYDDLTGDPVGKTTTDANGCYVVEGMAGGDYFARVPSGQTVLAGWKSVAVNPDLALAGEDETTDDNLDQNGRQFSPGGETETNVFNLMPGLEPVGEPSRAACGLSTLPDNSVNETADFAFDPAPPPELKVAMGNQLWIENNDQAGYQSNSDQPFANRTVELYKADGTFVTQDTTDGQGCYLFDNLDAGDYYVQVPAGQVPAGYEPDPRFLSDLQTVDDNLDHNARFDASSNVVTNLFSLTPGTQPIGEAGSACAGKTSSLPDENVNQTADLAFRLVPPPSLVSIGSTVWIDVNHNGVHDSGEPVIPNVEVELTGGAIPVGFPVTQKTDSEGNYRFSALAEGTYRVGIKASQLTTSGAVATALRDYWGAHGVSAAIPVKALATKLSADAADDTKRIDGDSDGDQGGLGYGGDVLSPPVTLTAGAEPGNGTSGEFQQTPGSNGFALDDLDESNGDMTVDFGFTHQCADICDIDGNGQVTQSDINAITTRLNKLAIGGPGAPHSGNCSGSGRVTGNDRLWCQAFVTP